MALPLPLTKLIHDNFSMVMMYAFSRPELERLVDTKFKGEWKYLNRALFEVPVERITRACLELALLLRVLDDEQDLSGYLKATKTSALGRVVKDGAPEEPLYLRDLTNKIMHASDFGWDFTDPGRPKLVCISSDPERWKVTEIDLLALAAFCGQLMS
jgi:hypothetical protein